LSALPRNSSARELDFHKLLQSLSRVQATSAMHPEKAGSETIEIADALHVASCS
jgi:hypothetical protein